MDEKTKKDFILIFNQGFEEVVMPEIVELEDKMEQGFKKVNSKLESIERRIDEMATKVGGHEKILKKSQSKSIAA